MASISKRTHKKKEEEEDLRYNSKINSTESGGGFDLACGTLSNGQQAGCISVPTQAICVAV